MGVLAHVAQTQVAAIVVVLRVGAEIATWPLEVTGRIDLAVVAEVARLQLNAGRIGATIHLRDAQPELVALLSLVGLVEVIGQAEGGEQVGVEEVVEPRDPIA
jgi:hypothetical protein